MLIRWWRFEQRGCRSYDPVVLTDVWIYDAKSRSGVEGPSAGYGITLVAETMKGFHKGADLVVDANMQEKLKTMKGIGGNEINELNSVITRKHGIEQLLEKEVENVKKDAEELNGVNQLSESELIGRLCAQRLLLEIHYGGVIDTTYQHIPFLFMALAEEHEPCKIKVSRIAPYAVQFLRHLKDFSGVTFSFEEVESPPLPRNEEEDQEEEEEIMQITSIIVKCTGTGFRNIGRKTF
ncbi:probable RNA 3'-terminal phosphate cyclase-like protein [Condylostylus longicornis]|uniref:probable RNA 3'-terminal phosphate cyclase-like protein n=1 Tax=Condylostylus longicornis TaxID=2530218 RepID=UPI00244DB88D|nr:probable RNA 3'-terminal phosphate cyclase-like protein [Condylostylus longicornis]